MTWPHASASVGYITCSCANLCGQLLLRAVWISQVTAMLECCCALHLTESSHVPVISSQLSFDADFFGLLTLLECCCVLHSTEALPLSALSFRLCRDPIVAIAAVGGVGLGGLALLDWHYALQYVGTFGLLVSTVQWLTSYDSPQVSMRTLESLQAQHGSPGY